VLENRSTVKLNIFFTGSCHKMQNSNAEKLQAAISDDLFPAVQHISDVKQVLEEMKGNSQNLREPQIKALILLEKMGNNTYLYGDKNPYRDLIDFIMKAK
jgi:hypothetical protein